MNDEKSMNKQQSAQEATSEPIQSHPVLTGLGAAGGGIAGAAIGKSVAGRLGTAVGGVAGAIAGGIAGNAIAEIATEAIDEIQPAIGLGLGADTKPIELPRHYSWEELQALSKNKN